MCTPEKGKTIKEMRQMKVEEAKHYPLLFASHEEIVETPMLFMEALSCFYSLINSQTKVPVIGGKNLDLHLLYVEVTKRGGYLKVVEDHKWGEISKLFEYPATATSACYWLRKHYSNLLQKFEQHYFFKVKFPFTTPPTVATTSKSAPSRCATPVLTIPTSSFMQIKQHNADSGVSRFPTVFGKLDGKFENGYLVTVKMGSEVLNGVLYHPSIVQPNNGVSITGQPNMHDTEKKRCRKNNDLDRPKRKRSGYNFFLSQKHAMLKSQIPHRGREFTKVIGESWNNLSQDEKMVYEKLGLKDQERYKQELEEYKVKQEMTSEGALMYSRISFN